MVDFAVLDRDELGEDADGDLLGCDRADVETDRRVHVLERIGRDLVGDELVVDARDFRAAANQAEIPQFERRKSPKRFEGS